MTKLNFDKAFVEGRTLQTNNGKVTFKIYEIGELVIPTGFIVACDPFVLFDSAAFTTQTPTGMFSVILSVAEFAEDQRVAYAKLRFSTKISVRWEMALTPNQDISQLKSKEIYGYSVDAGTGCFMDAEAAEIFLEKLGAEVREGHYPYTDFMMEEMKNNYVQTWDWANFKLEESAGNLIAFTSGWGDGSYASYFGFDEDDGITCLVTSFSLFEDTDVFAVN